VVDVLDVDRALLHTRAAGRTRPQHVGVDDPASSAVPTSGAPPRAQLLGQRGVRLVGELLLAGQVLAAAGEQVGRLGVRVVTQRRDDELGRERLAGVPRRALRLAAPALGAGREVEQAFQVKFSTWPTPNTSSSPGSSKSTSSPRLRIGCSGPSETGSPAAA
jgi:hypothetical protein